MRASCPLSISLVIVLFSLMALPAHAVTVLEGDKTSPALNARFHIEVIKGEDIDRTPPLPTAPPSIASGLLPPVPVSQTTQPDVRVTSPYSIASLISRYNRQLEPAQVAHWSQTIQYLGYSYNVDPRLLASVVAVESSFRPAAISSSGAIGLGQLKPETAQWLGVADPYDPVQNLMGVAKYLRYLLNRYNGSTQHALAAYFQGQGTIDRNGIDNSALTYIGRINQVFSRSF